MLLYLCVSSRVASSLVMLRYDCFEAKEYRGAKREGSSYSVTANTGGWHLLAQWNFNIHRETRVKTRICLKRSLRSFFILFLPLEIS